MTKMDAFKIPIDLRKNETLETQISVFLKQMMSENTYPKATYLPSIEDLSLYNDLDSSVCEMVYLKLSEEGYIKRDENGFYIDKIQFKENFFNHQIPPLEAIEKSGFKSTFQTINKLKNVKVPSSFLIKERRFEKTKYQLVRNIYYADLVPVLMMDHYIHEDILNLDKITENIEIHTLLHQENIKTTRIQSLVAVKKAPDEILNLLNAPKKSGLIQNDFIQYGKNDEVITAYTVYAALNYVYKTTTHFN